MNGHVRSGVFQGFAATAATYIGLPIGSGGAHRLGRLSFAAAHDATLGFLEACTELTAPLYYTLGVTDVSTIPVDSKAVTELKKRFGIVRLSGEEIPVDRAADAVRFMQEIHPQPGVGAISLAVHAKFRVLDPATGAPLPGQDPARFRGKEYDYRSPLGTSGLKLSLRNRAALAISLSLPDLNDQELERIARWLQEHLPCKFSSKHWKRWSPTKTGSFVGRKIAGPNI